MKRKHKSALSREGIDVSKINTVEGAVAQFDKFLEKLSRKLIARRKKAKKS